MDYTVHYAGEPARRLSCSLIARWKRTDPSIQRGMVMSTSSGAKDLTVNRIIEVFDSDPSIDEVAMAMSRVPFLLIWRAGRCSDITGRAVVAQVRS